MARVKDSRFDYEISLKIFEGNLYMRGYVKMKEQHTLFIENTWNWRRNGGKIKFVSLSWVFPPMEVCEHLIEKKDLGFLFLIGCSGFDF